ncbi:hypothetical protein C7S16_3849 [Burkholderia thailandensis]|uniref:Uncharacterized protein n=1 Tax=Burkholderia thailandensis TaxID=57975 RepID=A0AAW9CVC4_BURTH|nr:hypothetical protein [Burkholderia thailandensis]MDW9254377.1 hypothetical protein [Burkholderia thailandensis]
MRVRGLRIARRVGRRRAINLRLASFLLPPYNRTHHVVPL